MIHVSELTCLDETGLKIISGATFDIGSDDRVAVLCAQQDTASLLCHALAGILHRTHPAHRIEGSVLFGSQPIGEIDASVRTEKIAYVPPNSDLLISGVKDSVYGEIALSLELTGTEPEIIREKVNYIIKRFSIEQLSSRDPDELSGGERHKVALAAMIVREPEILILDNPTMFLDITGVNNLLSVLRNYDGAIILADPNPYSWAPIVDKFLIITGTDVTIAESPEEFMRKYKDGKMPISLPSWLELYIMLREHLDLPDESGTTKSLETIRTIARKLK